MFPRPKETLYLDLNKHFKACALHWSTVALNFRESYFSYVCTATVRLVWAAMAGNFLSYSLHLNKLGY